MAKNFIDADFIKVKFLFQPSEMRKAELQRTYDRLIARSVGRVYVKGVHENHHIIPSSLGGSDDKSNIAVLTYNEHFLAHWLLVRLTTDKARISMLYAVFQMTKTSKNHKNRIVAGWQYALARRCNFEASLLRDYPERPKPSKATIEKQRQGLLRYYQRPGSKEALKISRNTPEALENNRKGQIKRFNQPGVLEAHTSTMNTPEVVEKCRQGRLNYFSQPGALEAHRASMSTPEAIENSRRATLKRFSQPGAKDAHKLNQREKTGRPIENVTLGVVFQSISSVTDYFGFKISHIGCCCAGKRKTAGGYVWRYITKEDFTSAIK